MTDFSMLLKKVNCRGFSMVEVITAMVVVSVLATGVFAATSFSKRMDVTAQQKLIAMSKVEEEMNDLKQRGAGALAVSADKSPDDPAAENANLCYSTGANCKIYDELNSAMKIFVSTIIKDTAPPDPNGREKEIVVRADWKDTLGAVRSVSAATYLQE